MRRIDWLLKMQTFFFLYLTSVGTIRSCPSSPLFIPVKLEKKSARRSRKHIKECGGGSTDSEEPAVMKESSKRTQCFGQAHLKISKCNIAEKKMDEGRHGTEGVAQVSQQSKVADSCSCEDQASSVSQEERMTCSVREQPPSQETSRLPGEHWAAAAAISVGGKNSRVRSSLIYQWPSASLHMTCHWIFYLEGGTELRATMFLFKDPKKDEEALAQMNGEERGHLQSRLKDFYEECVEVSIALEQSLNKHSWFKANSE